jgi:tripartite-type tricarboxylate transporter receptor subunit TctC
MNKIITVLALCLMSATAFSKETITVYFNASANQPNYAPYLKMLSAANKNQNRYHFQMELRPGGNGIIAVKAMDQSPKNSLATAAASFVENARSGALNEQDYVAVSAQGDACWAVITNVGNSAKGISSLQGQKEITIGTTGHGNVTHLTALVLAEKYGFTVRYIGYKTNFDALTNIAVEENINFTIERVSNYQNLKLRNPALQILGMSCNQRHPLAPEVKTLSEQGVTVPTILLVTIANTKMPIAKRKDIEKILEQAQAELGPEYLVDTADLRPPQFAKPKLSANQYFEQKVNNIKALSIKFNEQIENSKK